MAFIAIFFIKDAEAQLIGQISGGTPVFTVSTEELISNFKSNLNENSQLDINFTSVVFVANEDNTGYYLRFSGGGYVSNLTVNVVEGDGLYAVGTTSCTTKSCSSGLGCLPRMVTCTPCSGDCTRTVTTSSMLTP